MTVDVQTMALPLTGAGDLDPLMNRIGDARHVPTGQAETWPSDVGLSDMGPSDMGLSAM